MPLSNRRAGDGGTERGRDGGTHREVRKDSYPLSVSAVPRSSLSLFPSFSPSLRLSVSPSLPLSVFSSPVVIVVIDGANESASHGRGHPRIGAAHRLPDDLVEFD